MARRPRRPKLDCCMSWIAKLVKGHKILPDVTSQPVPNHCGAQVAVESFEARCRLLNAKLGLCFPTLSIQHLIDLQRDAKAQAATMSEMRDAYDEEYVFKLLKNNGLTSKEDYDNAPAINGRFTKDVQGLRHYKIENYAVCYLQESPLRKGYDTAKKMRQAIDEIANKGPIYAWFVIDHATFAASRNEIYRHPRIVPSPGRRLPTHAVLLVGFGARGRRTSVFAHQNNWGLGHHVRGRGVMESKGLIGVIVPKVVRNWN